MKCPKCGRRAKETQFDTMIAWWCDKCNTFFCDYGREDFTKKELQEAWNQYAKERGR